MGIVINGPVKFAMIRVDKAIEALQSGIERFSGSGLFLPHVTLRWLLKTDNVSR
jgi:hypothetical protein